MVEKPFVYTFPNKQVAYTIQVYRVEELPFAIHELGMVYPCPAIVLIGGASSMGHDQLVHLHRLFKEVLAPLAEALGAAIVDGGTDAGVMQLAGQVYEEMGATFPLIGVAAVGTIALSDGMLHRPDNELLEPHHTHFVLIPGSKWGDESPWIAQVASTLAQGKPSVTILVNGGEVAWEDIEESVKAQRPVVIIAGSGRTADKLTNAIRGKVVDERERELVASGLLQAIDPAEGLEVLTRTIRQILS